MVFTCAGRSRFLLRTVNAAGRNEWAYQPVVVATEAHPSAAASRVEPGLLVRHASEAVLDSSNLSDASVTPRLDLSALIALSPSRTGGAEAGSNYTLVFSGNVDVPETGSYTFTLIGNDAGRIAVDNGPLRKSPRSSPQVCGSAGDAARAVTGSPALARGRHRIELAETHTTGPDSFRVLWQRPATPLSEIPASALSHDTVTATASTTATTATDQPR